jgi:peptidoglycan/LPS O-acetylase OafA/YrhL
MESHSSPPARPHVLDSARGIAVLAVVAWHVYRLTVARGLEPHAVPVWFWPLGILRLGVDVFFVLSGLLVVRSWESIRDRASGTARAAVEFLRRRAQRILPLYWLSLVILVPLVATSLLDDPRRLFAFATLNQYVKFWLPARVNPVMWSLTTEWHFYLLVPAVAWLLARVGRWPVYCGCLALTLLWWLHPPFLLPSSFVFGRLDQFVAGAIVGSLGFGAVTHPVVSFVRRPGVVPAALAGMLVLGSYHGASLGLSNHLLPDALLHPLFGALTALVLLRALVDPPRVGTRDAVLAWFGTISFGLYLWHYPILDYGLRWTRASVPFPEWFAIALAVPVLVACSIGAAQVSYVLVERPVSRLGRRREPPRPAGTLTPWPSRRSSASRPSTASRCAARPTRIPSSPRAS